MMSDFEKYWEENASKESWANKAVAAKIWSDKQAKIDELQKRIDEALKILDGVRHNGAYRAIDALKGKQND